ncbi:infB, partial [Ophiophagus hannah]
MALQFTLMTPGGRGGEGREGRKEEGRKEGQEGERRGRGGDRRGEGRREGGKERKGSERGRDDSGGFCQQQKKEKLNFKSIKVVPPGLIYSSNVRRCTAIS